MAHIIKRRVQLNHFGCRCFSMKAAVALTCVLFGIEPGFVFAQRAKLQAAKTKPTPMAINITVPYATLARWGGSSDESLDVCSKRAEISAAHYIQTKFDKLSDEATSNPSLLETESYCWQITRVIDEARTYGVKLDVKSGELAIRWPPMPTDKIVNIVAEKRRRQFSAQAAYHQQLETEREAKLEEDLQREEAARACS